MKHCCPFVVLVTTLGLLLQPVDVVGQQKAVGPVNPAARAVPAEDQLQLQNIVPKIVQDTVERLYGGQVRTSVNASGTQSSIFLPGDAGLQTVITVNHTSKQIMINGPADSVRAWKRLFATMDAAPADEQEFTQLVPLARAQPDAIQQALQFVQLRGTTTGDAASPETVSRRPLEVAQVDSPDVPPPAPGEIPAGPDPDVIDALEQEGLLGPVQIEYLEDLDIIVLKGNKRDVERVMAIINEIEQLSVDTTPDIVVLDLQHVESQAMAELVTPLYDEILSTRQGRVSITPLIKPNSILLIGREENVTVVSDLIRKLDQPAEPGMQFRVFRLKHMSATDAEQTITEFYEERGGLGTKVRVVADFRSNSLIVQASPRDIAELEKLLGEVDVAAGDAVNEVRVFRLKNTLAEELAPVLEEALRGREGTQFGGQGGGGQFGGAGATNQPRSTALTMTTIDTQGKTMLRGGLLNDVQISADTRSNALIVRGPEESMPLIEALIRQLDDMPAEAAEIKVFTVVNGDAVLLTEVLQELFGNQVTTGQQQLGQFGIGLGENPLVPIRFSVDERTNSIIAAGSLADLRVVEALLFRLDEDDVRQRQSVVYRLRYAPAADVSNAINEFLRSERQLQDVAPAAVSPFQQIEREVIVVPEPVSNSLIVSATPRYFEEISRIVQEIDAQPPMVMIQVLIAEVGLDDFVELGMEFGLQEPLLFDRGVLTDILATPGFNFNNQALGNTASPAALATRSNVGSQGLSSFAVGRTNAQRGYGGFVFSASSDAVSVLIRALEEDRRLEILSRPQVMTMDNQPAFVQVGQRVPRITSTQLTQFGTINNTVLENVGILLGVTPRISPDGIVVMEIDAEKSELGEEDEGVVIAISAEGIPIRSPIINTTTAQTTVSARNGQTVVLGGLITETDGFVHRGIPVLSNIPVVGQMFGYDQQVFERTELLIIMTPYVVRSDNDISFINQMESERMSWCLADVYRVHGNFDAMPADAPFCETAVPEVYPDQDPSALEFLQQPGMNPQTAPSLRQGPEIEPLGHNEVVPVLGPRNATGAAARRISWQTNQRPQGQPAGTTVSVPGTPRLKRK